MMKLFLLFGLCSVVVLATPQRFDFYRLVKFQPETDAHIGLIQEWANNEDFDVWSEVQNEDKSIEVVLSPIAFTKYRVLSTENDLPYTILNNNIQKQIDEESTTNYFSRMADDIVSRVVGRYASHADVNEYLDFAVSENPSFLSTYIAGVTYEGREMKVLQIDTGNTKRSVWIECGIHARERITVSTCTYIIDQFITGLQANDPVIVDLLDYYDVHILPIVNPDGYEYTYLKNRMWRKNRVPNKGSSCAGVDLNRNFPFKWMEKNGASSDPCSDAYAGPSAMSESETKAVINALTRKTGRWDSFLDIHSYGQWYLVPFGYTNKRPVDYADLLLAAQVSAVAMESVRKTKFKVGNSYDLLYVSSGTTDDWAYGQVGVKYSYTIELPPDSANPGLNGFILPESRAAGVGEETFRGIVALYTEIRRQRGN